MSVEIPYGFLNATCMIVQFPISWLRQSLLAYMIPPLIVPCCSGRLVVLPPNITICQSRQECLLLESPNEPSSHRIFFHFRSAFECHLLHFYCRKSCLIVTVNVVASTKSSNYKESFIRIRPSNSLCEQVLSYFAEIVVDLYQLHLVVPFKNDNLNLSLQRFQRESC